MDIMVVFGQNGCIWEKWLCWKKRLYLDKMVGFGQNVCIWAK